jgi:hypothetical protein
MTERKTTATAKTRADSPFDFAQGRLCGNDGKKNKNNCKTLRQTLPKALCGWLMFWTD